MECSEVKELLSAYYDAELPRDQQVAMAEHVANCHECARELAAFRGLSAMTEHLADPAPPAHIWQQLEQQLDVAPRAKSAPAKGAALVRFGLATAAAILIAIAWFGSRTWFEHAGDRQMAAVFERYLEAFAHDPATAQQILLATYEGQPVDAERAIHTLGYRPAVADGMPAGYSVEATYVMKMPCCKCVQCLCKRSDGTTIAIFEHDDKQSDWFGDRRVTEAVCDGTQCRFVELDDRLAATWKRGPRHITVVGARNTAEVNQLVAWFDDRRRRSPR